MGPNDEAVELHVDLDRAATGSGRTVFRIPAQPPVGQDLVLSFDRATATLEVGGQSEPCIAFKLVGMGS
jgi:hypothetical protein